MQLLLLKGSLKWSRYWSQRPDRSAVLYLIGLFSSADPREDFTELLTVSIWIPSSFLLSPLSVTLFLILTILYCCEIFLGLSSHLSSTSLLAFVLWLEQWVFHLLLSFAIMPLCLLSSCSLCPFILITACMHLTLLRHCLRWLTPYFLSMCHLDLNLVLLFSLTLLPSFCFYRMNQVRAWTLGPSVTCGKSFLKKWKENVLLYSPLTGKSLMHVPFFTLSWFSQVNYIWCNVEHTEITVVFWLTAAVANYHVL